jgi:hypothetical protein
LQDSVIEVLTSGESARLIPSVSDQSREVRVTSSLLATFTVVPAFAAVVLDGLGAPLNSRTRIQAFTEVVFKGKELDKKSRPDGLLVLTSGNRTWTALIEAKIGGALLQKEQLEEYLDLAKTLKIDAVITLSNQFALLPWHHPIAVSKQKVKNVQLFHLSWLSVLSKAILISQNKQVGDPEQAFILKELVRYLEHEASGVSALSQMGPGWKQVCADVQHGNALGKSDHVRDTVASWHQLIRYLSIELSLAVGKPVQVALSRAHYNDAALKFQEDIEQLARDQVLRAEFDIPNGAARVVLSADFRRRTLNLAMRLDAPRDRTRATASINWFCKQLAHLKDDEVIVRAYWPRRLGVTAAPIGQVLEDPRVLTHPDSKELPTAFEAVRVVDLAGRFRGAKTFVEDAQRILPEFYGDVAQRLTRWVAKPPPIKSKETDVSTLLEDAIDALEEAQPEPAG